MTQSTSLVLSIAALLLASSTAMTQENTATVLQGGVARWSGGNAKECGIFGRRFGAIDGVCFYPVDMKAEPGVHEIAMWDEAGARTLGTLTVTKRECTETEITLTDEAYVEISDANKTRGAEERARIVKAVAGVSNTPPGFALPLGPPAEGVATKDRSDFCELRLYNSGKVRSRHTGLDYPLPAGTAVVAGADGTVTLAEDQFYTGKTVVVDHGGGLVTMVFHLDDIKVEAGATVQRGDGLATVGSTGRSTGPHLHYGARYQNQRIDVGALIGDPMKLPGVGEAMALPAQDTAAVITDSNLPSVGDTAGEDMQPAESAAEAGDDAPEDAQSANQTGDANAVDAVEQKEDVIKEEAEEQQQADDAAKKQ